MKQLFTLLLLTVLCACKTNVKNITTITSNDSQLIICDGNNIEEKRDIKLSNLIDDFQIIKMDNRKEAFFKWNWIFFSENYICIKQSEPLSPVKLFNKKGEFISDVGTVGRGPGEYRSAYNVLIDEKEGNIYIAPLAESNLLKFDLKGKFQREINLGEKLNKPKMYKQLDSTLSVVQLCFKDRGDKFTAANVQLNNSDSIDYVYFDALTTNFKNASGMGDGYNAEIWSYNNVPEFVFMMTHSDTLYHYDSNKNKIEARFTINFNETLKKDHFTIINEFPHYYLVSLVGPDGKKILVDKAKQEAFNVSIINDFMGNMVTSLQFQDGYYFATYEPITLMEKIQEHLDSGNCPEGEVEKLTQLKNSLNENDNNVLLLGKLKR